MRLTLLIVILFVSALVVGCTGQPTRGGTAAPSSVETTIGPVGVGTTVTAAPYEIALVQSNILSDPQPGPDMAAVPPVPSGFDLGHFRVAVHNPSHTSEQRLPSMDGFRLVDAKGNALESVGLGFFRDQPTGSNDSRSPGTGEMSSTPLRPLETAWFEPQFLVREDGGTLTLIFEPMSEDTDVVVEFSIR